jgi:hypothetical protein
VNPRPLPEQLEETMASTERLHALVQSGSLRGAALSIRRVAGDLRHQGPNAEFLYQDRWHAEFVPDQSGNYFQASAETIEIKFVT